MDTRCKRGGIERLRELIDKHTIALAADFRSRYNLSIFDAGETYTYKEAIFLTAALFNDTKSLFFADYNQWEYPVSQEFLALADIFDLTYAINSKKKLKPYRRPFQIKQTDDMDKIGRTVKTKSDIEKILNRMNPNRVSKEN